MRHGVARRARASLLALTQAGLVALAVLLGAAATAALAVDPTATPAGGGDVRTNPAAPGLVGDPLFALLGVAVVGLVALIVTLAAVRLTARR